MFEDKSIGQILARVVAVVGMLTNMMFGKETMALTNYLSNIKRTLHVATPLT